MRGSLNVGHDGRADISLRAGLYKDRANKANVKIGQRKCHIYLYMRAGREMPYYLYMRAAGGTETRLDRAYRDSARSVN
jgi:hypothetical protein